MIPNSQHVTAKPVNNRTVPRRDAIFNVWFFLGLFIEGFIFFKKTVIFGKF